MKHIRLLILASSIVLLAFSSIRLLFAQAGAGGIVGSVHDPSGAVIPGASVVIRQLETHVETKTTSTEAGKFSFPTLPVGHYDVTASFQGFASVTKQNVQVVLGQSITVDFELPVATAVQATTVTAAAPVLDTTSTSTGTTATINQLADLPLEVSGGRATLRIF